MVSMTNTKKREAYNKSVISNIIFCEACKIQNGSIKIIKQDNTVIQVNINETIILEHLEGIENIAEEAIL